MNLGNGRRWLCLLALSGFGALAGRGADREQGPPLQMEKFTVNRGHLMAFGIAISMWEDKNTERVLEMSVKAVRPDSNADWQGVKPGTRIYSINGVPVESFVASFAAGTDLNKIFVDRKKGDQVTLELSMYVNGRKMIKYVTLVEEVGMSTKSATK
ncbi:MAG: hypothetical protein ABI222_11220 [Opitutaceae bacterium]